MKSAEQTATPIERRNFPTLEDIDMNNGRSLYVKCKAARDDLVEVRARAGAYSEEYDQKLKQVVGWFRHSLTDVFDYALNDLARHGRIESTQTTRTD